MKRIICTIMSLIMSMTLLAGCNLFVHNYERDYMQVIATIQPITESGTREDGSAWTYTSEKKEIYKSTLVNYFNSNGMSSIQAGMSVENTVNDLMEQIVQMELLLIEADIRLESGEIAWTMSDIEAVKHSVYANIDTDLFSIYNQILGERDEPLMKNPETSDISTTYPLFENDYGVQEDEEIEYYTGTLGQYHDEWYLDTDWYIEDSSKYANKYPGYHGSINEKSLGREAMKRLITVYVANGEALLNLTDAEEKAIKEDIKKIEEIEKEQGVEYVYPMLGRTTLIKKLYGEGFIKEKKVEMLEKMITDGITASKEEVTQKYNNKLDAQKLLYDSNISKYHEAITGDEEPLVLYNPEDHYVYVKHILLPFTEEKQTELRDLEGFVSDEKYQRALQEAVSQTVAYPHIDGEDDTNRPMTVEQVYNEVRAALAPLASSPYAAERKMNELIYKYNTDPGIFANDLGYAVKYKLDEGEEETYMVAFAEGAREFRDKNYKVGQLLDHYVITSYGVHIMYYAGNTEQKVKGIDDYQTAGQYKKIYDLLEEEVITDKSQSVFNTWQDTRIYYYENTAKKVDIDKKLINKFIKQILG